MAISSGTFETLLVPSNDTLISWGANYKPLTLDGQWWRLLSCVFEHIGIIHLVMNMYALMYVGIQLEPILGRGRFLVSYLATGVAASLISLWWHDNIISAGASGAIFGMYGLFLGLLLTNVIDKQTRQALLPSIGIFIAYNLVFGMRSGVDNAAHIGGLIAGFIIGLGLYFSLKKPSDKKLEIASIIGIVVAITFATSFTLPAIKNPIGDYIQIMDEFAKKEEEALKVYALPESANQQTVITALKNSSIPGFERCSELIRKAEAIGLPDELKPRLALLKQYVGYRSEEASLRLKSLEEDTDQYNEQINMLVKSINSVIEQLNKN